jgi:RHS repeat-associated protein
MYDYQRDGLDTAIYSLNYYYQSIWQDQLDYYDILVNGSVYTQDIVSYDGQGNPTEIDNFVYTTISGTESVYDHAILIWEARTLTSITVYNESDVVQAEISYNYNANGYRTSKSITKGTSSKQFTNELIDSLVISEKIVKIVNSVQTTQTIFYYYDTDGTLIGFNLNLEDYFYINNIQGDITGIVDVDGNVIVKYDYDSYGNIISCDPDSGFEYVIEANAYTYRGYRYDSEIRMYYLNSRYYNPDTGRFISSDAILGAEGEILSTNMYTYCQNDPVNNIDPTGYVKAVNYSGWDAWKQIGLMIYGVVGNIELIVCLIWAISFSPLMGWVLQLILAAYISVLVVNSIYTVSVIVAAIYNTIRWGGFSMKQNRTGFCVWYSIGRLK